MTYRDLYPRTLRRNYGEAIVEFRQIQRAAGGKYLEGCAVPYKAWADIGPFLEQIWPSCFVESLQNVAKHSAPSVARRPRVPRRHG